MGATARSTCAGLRGQPGRLRLDGSTCTSSPANRRCRSRVDRRAGELKDEGKIRHVGVSNVTRISWEAERVTRWCGAERYNVVDGLERCWTCVTADAGVLRGRDRGHRGHPGVWRGGGTRERAAGGLAWLLTLAQVCRWLGDGPREQNVAAAASISPEEIRAITWRAAACEVAEPMIRVRARERDPPRTPRRPGPGRAGIASRRRWPAIMAALLGLGAWLRGRSWETIHEGLPCPGLSAPPGARRTARRWPGRKRAGRPVSSWW